MTEQQHMSLVEHLTELRRRLIYSLIGVGAGMGLCFWQSERLFEIVRRPIQPYLGGQGLVFTGVMDKFLAHLKVGMLGGVVLTCPYWLYHVWKFIAPGLYQKERRIAIGFIATGTLLFLIGVSFVYFLVYPAAFEYLLHVGGEVDHPMITIDQYLSFFTNTTLMFGVAFELPLILVLLAMMGVIDAAFLKKQRRVAIPALSVIAAVITPPDLISMIMMLVPMILLYEIAIVAIKLIVKRPVAA